MSTELRCIEAFPVRRDGDTITRRCTGVIIEKPDDPGTYACSRDGIDHDPIVYNADLVLSMQESPGWHMTNAVYRLLRLLTGKNIAAYNSSFPWIDIPLSLTSFARISTTTGAWVIDIYDNSLPVATFPTSEFATSADAERVAYAIHSVLTSHLGETPA